jgi:hypothetical protein
VHGFLHVQDGLREATHGFGWLAEQVKRQTLGSFGSDARQRSERFDGASDRLNVHGL